MCVDYKNILFQIQGAIILASCVQVLVGVFGIVGLVLRFIGPLTVATTISLVGLSLCQTAIDTCAQQWWISIM